MRNIQWLRAPSLMALVLLVPAALSAQTAEDFDKLNAQCWELIRARQYAQAEMLAKKLLAWAKGPLAEQPLHLASACDILGRVYDCQGRYGKVEPLYKQALQIKRRVLGQEHPDVAASLTNLAVLYWNQGRYSEAEPLCKQALEINRKVLGQEHPDVAASLNNLAALYWRQGRYCEAEPLYEQALGIQRKVLGGEHPDVAASLNNLAVLYWSQGRYAEAEPLYKRALEIRRKVLPKEHPDVAASLHNLANLYWRQGRYCEAEPLYKQALRMKRRVLGQEHPDVAASLHNLALLYSDQGRYSEAELLYKQALEIRCKVLGQEHPDVAAGLNNLAVLYWSQGRYAEAEPLYKRALEIHRKVLPKEHPDVAASLHNLANLYWSQGRYAEAEPLYKQALRMKRRVLGQEHPSVAGSLNNLGSLYFDQGRYAEAEPLYNEAVRLARQGRCEPLTVARIWRNRAELHWHAQRKQEAVADLERALRTIEQQRVQVSGAELERAGFFGHWTGLFESMVAWQTELGNPAMVLDALERSRARSLLDQMATAGVDLLAGLAEQEAQRLRENEARAAGRVASLCKQLDLLPARRDMTEEQKEREEERLNEELRRARFEHVQAYAELRSASPVYRLAISNGQKPVSLQRLKQWVEQDGALLLEYLLGKDNGYLFLLPAGGDPQVVRLGLNEQQAKALGVEPGPLTAQRMRAILARENKTGVLDHLRASDVPEEEQQAAAGLAVLWEVLIPESQRKVILEDEYDRLVVLPDGLLAQLPFETLVVEPADEPKYLLDVGPPILYGPSATVLVNLQERRGKAARANREPVLAVGDCLYRERARAPGEALAELAPRARFRNLGGQRGPLEYSLREIQWVAEVFGKKQIEVAWLRQQMATEANVRHNIPGRWLVDLACHGRADDAYGNLFGALALTPGADAADEADDGLLTLKEIYELELAGCELAILSACHTNVGPEQRGEGGWALSRGFLTAGSRRVVASSWLLDDESAANTVSYFCAIVAAEQAKGGEVDYARALQEAKRWLRSVKTDKHDWSSPYYWAPMVLVGPH